MFFWIFVMINWIWYWTLEGSRPNLMYSLTKVLWAGWTWLGVDLGPDLWPDLWPWPELDNIFSSPHKLCSRFLKDLFTILFPEHKIWILSKFMFVSKKCFVAVLQMIEVSHQEIGQWMCTHYTQAHSPQKQNCKNQHFCWNAIPYQSHWSLENAV